MAMSKIARHNTGACFFHDANKTEKALDEAVLYFRKGGRSFLLY